MREGMTPVPVRRRALRLWLGARYFRARRWVWWRLGGVSFAGVRIPRVPIGARPTPPR